MGAHIVADGRTALRANSHTSVILGSDERRNIGGGGLATSAVPARPAGRPVVSGGRAGRLPYVEGDLTGTGKTPYDLGLPSQDGR